MKHNKLYKTLLINNKFDFSKMGNAFESEPNEIELKTYHDTFHNNDRLRGDKIVVKSCIPSEALDTFNVSDYNGKLYISPEELELNTFYYITYIPETSIDKEGITICHFKEISVKTVIIKISNVITKNTGKLINVKNSPELHLYYGNQKISKTKYLVNIYTEPYKGYKLIKSVNAIYLTKERTRIYVVSCEKILSWNEKKINQYNDKYTSFLKLTLGRCYIVTYETFKLCECDDVIINHINEAIEFTYTYTKILITNVGTAEYNAVNLIVIEDADTCSTGRSYCYFQSKVLDNIKGKYCNIEYYPDIRFNRTNKKGICHPVASITWL
jgi:hypothetical protein